MRSIQSPKKGVIVELSKINSYNRYRNRKNFETITQPCLFSSSILKPATFTESSNSNWNEILKNLNPLSMGSLNFFEIFFARTNKKIYRKLSSKNI